MKRYCYVKNNEIVKIEPLPINFGNVSNFYLLSDEEIKPHGWLPIETISENKPIQLNVEYVIENSLVKEIIATRDKTEQEINEEHRALENTKWLPIRTKRDTLLKNSDTHILPDKWEEMDSTTKQAWSTYRQQLRDIPQSFNTPEVVIWPTNP
jgi:hypothetical protein